MIHLLIIVIIITIIRKSNPHIINKKRMGVVFMPITFAPLRSYIENNAISYYSLANQGIDPQTLQRIRHDQPITTDTLAKLCRILRCQPGELLEYVEDSEEPSE